MRDLTLVARLAGAAAALTLAVVLPGTGGADVATLRPDPAAAPAAPAPRAAPAAPASHPPPVATPPRRSPLPRPTPAVAPPPVPVPTTLPPVPLPPVGVFPVPIPPEPAGCPADHGVGPLPVPDRDHDLSGEGGVAVDPIVAGGRLWFTVGGADSRGTPGHVVSVDPVTGARRSFRVPEHANLADVVGHRAYVTENQGATVYDARTGAVLRRWRPGVGPLRYREPDGNVDLWVAGLTADADGAWLLGSAGGIYAVVRVANDGTVRWRTRLPDPTTTGYSVTRGSMVADHGGYLYVGQTSEGAGPAFWRFAPDGRLVARSRPELPSINTSVHIAASAAGVFAGVAINDDLDSMVMRFDPVTLRPVFAARVETMQSMHAGDRAVYVNSYWCDDTMLTRYDALTMRRTGWWRLAYPDLLTGSATDGAGLWLLHTTEPGHAAVALRRYPLA